MGLSPETVKRIQQFRSQRYGVVVDVFIKATPSKSRGTIKHKFVKVLWDGLKTPSDHAQMRLIHEHELPELIQNYRGGI